MAQSYQFEAMKNTLESSVCAKAAGCLAKLGPEILHAVVSSLRQLISSSHFFSPVLMQGSSSLVCNLQLREGGREGGREEGRGGSLRE